MAEKLIGTDIAPPDLIAKITGRAKYSEDFRADNMAFAKILASPMPHARVRRVDASRALALPGVLGILRAEDVPQRDGPREAVLTDEPHYEGEPILAIAAETEQIAAAAIELIDIDFEPLPFVIDPLESLRPGGPNAYSGGNLFSDDAWSEIKWTAEDFAEIDAGRMPNAEAVVEWSKGDVSAAFAASDLILDEVIVHQSLSHHPMEPRSNMAYWENGKLFAHVSTQSAQRTKYAMAGMLDMDPEDIVLVAEYCGGGFGSKISGSTIMALPAFFSRKINRPVMHRVTRAEENYIGRARPGFQSWLKMGFLSSGKCNAIDLYLVEEAGAYGSGDNGTAGMVADLTYTPQNMRFRAVSIYTNTPPKAAQRGPGGAQIISMMEPILDKAGRELGIDRLEMRMINAPDADVSFGPRDSQLTSVHAKEALRMGAEMFDWAGKQSLSGQRVGSKVSGIGIGLSPYTAGSRGFDGLMLISPEDGKLHVHQGIGNLGTHSIADTARPAAEILGLNWDQVEIVWGNSSRGMPRSSVQAGSQTTHAHTRANHAAAMDARRKIQEVAARTLGGAANAYRMDNGVVTGPGGRMTFAQIAARAIELGGEYDGHTLPDDIHETTVPAATGLAGKGLMGVAKDNYGGEGGIYSWVAGFAHVELDVETGVVEIKEYVGITDCGTVIHPRSLGAQVLGGSIQGMGMAMTQRWVFDPQYGVPFAKRLYTARPPGILDVPPNMSWGAVGIADPQSPVGAKGIGEPPVGAGAAALTTAVADAMGGKCLCRTPLTPDIILAELEGRTRAHGRLDMHVG
jgi:CO/xanthine dehydrogenase Mo-binding subunit